MKSTFIVFRLSLLLMVSNVAMASEYSVTNFMGKSDAIHHVNVDVNGRCCGVFRISTQVGYLVNHTCQYQQETPSHEASACDVLPFGTFVLNGAILEQLVGNQWDCAATVVDSLGEPRSLDAFVLLKNRQKHYVTTKPTLGHVALPICHG